MKSYHLAWAVFLTYHHQKKQLTLDFSHAFKDKYKIDNQVMILEDEDLKSFIHKYDYRKLEYFSESSLKVFDTELKFRLKEKSPYIRTQAICQASQHGFECLLIEEKVLFETKKTLSKTFFQDIEIEFLEHDLEKTQVKHKALHKMTHQLNTFFERRMI